MKESKIGQNQTMAFIILLFNNQKSMAIPLTVKIFLLDIIKSSIDSRLDAMYFRCMYFRLNDVAKLKKTF